MSAPSNGPSNVMHERGDDMEQQLCGPSLALEANLCASEISSPRGEETRQGPLAASWPQGLRAKTL